MLPFEDSIDLSDWIADFPGSFPELYLVGGAVRDLHLGREAKDFDLVCTGARKIAQALAAGRNVAVVPMEKDREAPCFRLVDREDPRRTLDIAELRGSLERDLRLRDFTINALAIRIGRDGRPKDVIDPTGGVEDIGRRLIRMTGPDRFEADPLRILRAFRLAAQLDFAVDGPTRKAIGGRAPLLNRVSPERIVSELLLILGNSESSPWIREMGALGVIDVIFPEIPPCRSCDQNWHHHTNVWQHSLLVLENVETLVSDLAEHFGELAEKVLENLAKGNRLPLLKLAALLHDIGKPATRVMDAATGRISFPGHAEAGAALVSLIAERLRLSNRDREFLHALVAEHLHVQNLSSPAATARDEWRWLRKLREDAVPALLLGMSDRMSTLGPHSDPESREAHLAWSKQAVRRYYGPFLERTGERDLLTGGDLIALGMKPGPEMGEILLAVREAQDFGEVRDKEDALELARGLMRALARHE